MQIALPQQPSPDEKFSCIAGAITLFFFFFFFFFFFLVGLLLFIYIHNYRMYLRLTLEIKSI